MAEESLQGMQETLREIGQEIQAAERVLIGIGEEWDSAHCSEAEAKQAYEALYQLVKDKDYFIVTTVTDAKIFGSSLDNTRIAAPCGNDTWKQCENACTKDIWEEGEVPDEICPHCGAKLVSNTIRQEHYIEEGYLPQWNVYTAWLQKTLNRKVVILELGEGFLTPTVMRWPFEKVAFFNKKARFYRINEKFPQVSEELREKACAVKANSVKVVFDISALA